ncbi:MAG: 2,3-cyclic 3-phosphodiesterase, partial [Streptomyces sp.]|nr:2,3-cyclic 3-phosphodiesterase [Streptomyces sp.]
WTDPTGWHFTLAFLGEVPDPARSELDEHLARAARGHGPYELRLAGGGRFGDRALWVGADGDLTGLAQLAGSVRAAARRAGAPPDEEYGFQPHLTLARSRDRTRTRTGTRTRTRTRTDEGGRGPGSVDLRPFVEALADFAGEPWGADRLSLVSSALPRSGTPGEQPRYTVEASWPLGPAVGPAAPDAEPPGGDG